jgi:N6-adenosine-specific RNA methylase IME4
MMENKKYSVIYADPPWKTTAGVALDGYKIVDGKQIWNRTTTKTRPLAYDTMTLEEIAAMPIGEIAAADAHLYIWVTNGYLPFIFEIIKSWGFEYSTTLVWAKNGGGLGGAFKITTEFLLFCRRGKLKTKDTIRNTWFNVKKEYVNGYPKHSKKPFFFRHMIEQVSPGPYLELFARDRNAGWDVFGNEVEGSIKLENKS